MSRGRRFLNDDKLSLNWEAPRALLPKNQVKLVLNLLMLATHAIPRGGKIDAKATVEGENGQFTVICTGQNARIPHGVQDLIAGKPESGTIDAHAVQPYYTGLIARAAGMTVDFSLADGVVTITSKKLDATAPAASAEA